MENGAERKDKFIEIVRNLTLTEVVRYVAQKGVPQTKVAKWHHHLWALYYPTSSHKTNTYHLFLQVEVLQQGEEYT